MTNRNVRIANELVRLAKYLMASEETDEYKFMNEYEYKDANPDIKTVDVRRPKGGDQEPMLDFTVEFIPKLAGLSVHLEIDDYVDEKQNRLTDSGNISVAVKCKYWFEQSFYKNCSWQPELSEKEKVFNGSINQVKSQIDKYIASFTDGLTIKK